MTQKQIKSLIRRGGIRLLDTPTELRVRLHKTCFLPISEISFYHELDSPKGEQIVAATLSKDGSLLDIVLFVDRLK
jgi:hypothetical protein